MMNKSVIYFSDFPWFCTLVYIIPCLICFFVFKIRMNVHLTSSAFLSQIINSNPCIQFISAVKFNELHRGEKH